MIKTATHFRNLLFPLAIVVLGCLVAYGATNQLVNKPFTGLSMPPKDTIHVIWADKTLLHGDSLMELTGNVKLKQGTTLFTSDRAIKNNALNTFEAWGKVHIVDADTTNIYSDHLKYLGNTQMAYLDGNVKLTDGQVTLTTPELSYDMTTNIGIYRRNGKVVNNKTVITSKEGEYYRDIQDVYFKKDVVVTDPAYNITTDSLRYNTGTQIATFITTTHIKDSARRSIDTKEGFYNLKTGQAAFGQSPLIVDTDKKTSLKALNVELDDNIARAEGNAIVVDSIRGTTIIANLIFQNRINEAVLATQKPVLIVKQENDSIFIAADTLFTAKLSDLFEELPVNDSTDSSAVSANPMAAPPSDTSAPSTLSDTSKQAIASKASAPIATLAAPVASALSDTSEQSVASKASVLIDTLAAPVASTLSDTSEQSVATKASALVDTLAAPVASALSDTSKQSVASKASALVDTLAPPVASANVDTSAAVRENVLVKKETKDSSVAVTPPKTQAANDSTDRYFEAFHHVRIYSDSMQAISDSLFYSFKDSTFRLYKEPVVWGKESQITGDTILLHTKNRQPSWMEAFKNGFMVNYIGTEAYNQIKATRIDAYFINGDLDSVRAKGSAQSIYYLQDDDSAFTGVNESKSDIIDSYFKEKQLFKVAFRSEVEGTIYPIQQKKPGEMKLEGFIWREALRPKSKYELFE